jgi:predicted O-methyltransferase YrrM
MWGNMKLPKQINKLARNELKRLDMKAILPFLKDVNKGSMRDINDVSTSLYYRYLAALVKAVKPKQVVEMGSAGGASALMMLSTLPKDSMLYALTFPETEGEFRFIKEDYPNLTLIRGDSRKLEDWPKNCKLGKTDIWFIDTHHSYEQLHLEMNLYKPFFKKGAIILLDDIRLNEEMVRAWDEIEYPKLSLPDLHWSGFGMVVVDE